MPDSLLTIFKFLLVALVYLFFLRVLQAVWSGLRAPVATPAAVAPSRRAARAATAPPAATRAGTERPAASDGDVLQIVEPAKARGRTFPIADEMTIGRAAGCGIPLDDGAVSQLHARVFRRDGRAFLEDLGSTNGTLLNRQKVTAPVELRRGDRIQVGRIVLEVRR